MPVRVFYFNDMSGGIVFVVSNLSVRVHRIDKPAEVVIRIRRGIPHAVGRLRRNVVNEIGTRRRYRAETWPRRRERHPGHVPLIVVYSSDIFLI